MLCAVRTYEALATQWYNTLRAKKGSDRLARYSWFLFDIMIKSMLLHAEEVKAADTQSDARMCCHPLREQSLRVSSQHTTSLPGCVVESKFPSLRRSKREFVSKDFLKVLNNLVAELSQEIQRLASKTFGKMLNRNFALFLR